MDLLADIFRQADLKRRILNQRSLVAPIVLRFPCNKSIGFHIVTSGEIFLYTEGKEKPLLLCRGDLVVMARGCDHVLSTQKNLSAKQIKTAQSLDESSRIDAKLSKTQVAAAVLVSGAYQLWNDPLHPFFKDWPDMFVLKNSEIDSFGQIQSALNMLAMETSNPQMGTEGLVQNLLDIIFSYLLRKIAETKGPKSKSWTAAIRNESIRKAIELMHEQIDRNWTLDDLAKEVGLSRAGLAQKFKASLGDTPLHYLTLVRVQKARNLLSSTNDNLELIAAAVGYSDPFSFSKVFKRITGVPPRVYRQEDQREKALAYRF